MQFHIKSHKKMSYSKFTLEKVVESFDLKIFYVEKIISEKIINYPVSDFLKETFRRNQTKAFLINTEKARSELLVAPNLVELQEIKNNEITFFSSGAISTLLRSISSQIRVRQPFL